MTMEYVNIGMMYENSQQKSATIELIRKSQKSRTLSDAESTKLNYVSRLRKIDGNYNQISKTFLGLERSEK
jgi:hypothetical protein